VIIVDDLIVKKIGTQNRQDRFYRTFCNTCGSDRGYLLKSQDKRPTCNKCAKVGSSVSEEVRNKMSAAAHFRKPRVKKEVDGRSLRDKATYVGPQKILTESQRKIRHSIRSLIWQKLRNRGICKKSNKTFNLLGYSPETLTAHLESRWQPGMSWGNYDKHGWHIDHVVPDSWFKYSSTDEQDFKKSWALENLQPLWADINHSKGNRYAGGGK
jgi:hypothetical protein